MVSGQYIFNFIVVIIIVSLLAFLIGKPKIRRIICIFISKIYVVASILLYNSIAFAYFFIVSFLSSKPLFYVDGTALDHYEEVVLLRLSIAFGIVYLLAFLISRYFIGKYTTMTKWKSKVLINIVLLTIVCLTYPLIIYTIFIGFMLSFYGVISLMFLVFLIWFLQSPLFKRRIQVDMT